MFHFVSQSISQSVHSVFWRCRAESYAVARLHLLCTLPELLTTGACFMLYSCLKIRHVYLNINVNVDVNVHPKVHLDICLNVHQNIHLNVYLNIHLIDFIVRFHEEQ